MGNMSYCRFENTLNDLKDCYLAMDEELDGSEKAARLALIELCGDITEEYGDEEKGD